MRTSMLIVLAMTLLPGCVHSADTAFKVAGQIVRTNGEPYQHCQLQVRQGEKVVYAEDIEGLFETTVIFHPLSGKPLDLEVSCDRANETFEYQLVRIPRPFGKVVHFGRVVLE